MAASASIQASTLGFLSTGNWLVLPFAFCKQRHKFLDAPVVFVQASGHRWSHAERLMAAAGAIDIIGYATHVLRFPLAVFTTAEAFIARTLSATCSQAFGIHRFLIATTLSSRPLRNGTLCYNVVDERH